MCLFSLPAGLIEPALKGRIFSAGANEFAVRGLDKSAMAVGAGVVTLRGADQEAAALGALRGEQEAERVAAFHG
jgi:hypothetical protein